MEPWKLEAEDTKLLDLLPFLEAVVRAQVPPYFSYHYSVAFQHPCSSKLSCATFY